MGFKIGVIIDSFRGDLLSNIKKASKAGVQGIQIYATEGEMAPENITKEKINYISSVINGYGLHVCAICGDLGGYGFKNKEDNAWKIEKSKRIVDLAAALNCNVITTHIGVIPADPNNEKRKVMREACEILGLYSESQKCTFAIETGPEKASTLKGFLDSLSTKGIGVNLDPANLVMVTDDDPVAAVYTLKDYIVHVHAKDGIMIKKTDPEIIYNFFAQGGIGDLRLENYFKEVPLGHGKVDFDNFIKALRDIGYAGFLTIEREVGDNPEKDIKEAVDFLKRKIN